MDLDYTVLTFCLFLRGVSMWAHALAEAFLFKNLTAVLGAKRSWDSAGRTQWHVFISHLLYKASHKASLWLNNSASKEGISLDFQIA